MCRAKDCGGRRCQRGWTTSGKAKHNQMRRENRAIRRNAAQWARDHGNADFAAQIEQMKPGEVKEVLRELGADPKYFKDEVPDGSASLPHTSTRVEAIRYALGPERARAVVNGAGGAPPAAPAGGAAGGAPAPVGVGQGGGGSAAAAGPSPSPAAPAWSREGWCTDALRPRIEAVIDAQGGHRDERSLLAGRSETVTPVAAGVNTTRRVEFDNGTVGYFKPFDEVDDGVARGFGHEANTLSVNEAAAWQLASRMGPPYSDMVPPVVVRQINGQMGSVALERPGKMMQPVVEGSPEWREAALFDALVGQQDRHPGNYLMAGDRITLIDHGYTFARPGDYKNYSWFVLRRERQCADLTYQERELLQRVASSPDLMGMRKMLSADRASALQQRAERMLATGRITTDY